MELLFQEHFIILVLLMLWVLPWKGYALWTAATHNHKWWFVALLVINTLAILDIIYIFLVARRGPALWEFFVGKQPIGAEADKKKKEEEEKQKKDKNKKDDGGLDDIITTR